MRLNAVKLHSVQSNNAKFSPAKNSAPKAKATQNPLKELSSIPTNKVLAQMGNISFGKTYTPEILDSLIDRCYGWNLYKLRAEGKFTYGNMDFKKEFNNSARQLRENYRQLAIYRTYSEMSEADEKQKAKAMKDAYNAKEKMLYCYSMTPTAFERWALLDDVLNMPIECKHFGNMRDCIPDIDENLNKQIEKEIRIEAYWHSLNPHRGLILDPKDFDGEKEEIQQHAKAVNAFSTYLYENNFKMPDDEKLVSNAFKSGFELLEFCSHYFGLYVQSCVSRNVKEAMKELYESIPADHPYKYTAIECISEYDLELASALEDALEDNP